MNHHNGSNRFDFLARTTSPSPAPSPLIPAAPTPIPVPTPPPALLPVPSPPQAPAVPACSWAATIVARGSAAGPAAAHAAAHAAVHAVAPAVEGYEVIGLIGEGGMGAVWEAVQLGTRRRVALKVMKPELFASTAARKRFEREVEVQAKLEHPHIARVYEGGLDRGVCFFAMELIDGGVPLDRFVRTHNLASNYVLRLVKQVCRAVQYAHQHGTVHRDLKPANILVDRHARPRVMDFGLAKSAAVEGSLALTMDGEFAGTIPYMAPEQASGKPNLDARVDVYALGVILYELLTGQHPHDLSGNPLSVLRRIIDEPPVPPRQAGNGDVDAALEAILLKALEKDPQRRYADAGALADDIDQYLRGQATAAKPPTALGRLRAGAARGRRRLALAASALAALVCTVAVVSFVLRNPSGQKHASATSRPGPSFGHSTNPSPPTTRSNPRTQSPPAVGRGKLAKSPVTLPEEVGVHPVPPVPDERLADLVRSLGSQHVESIADSVAVAVSEVPVIAIADAIADTGRALGQFIVSIAPPLWMEPQVVAKPRLGVVQLAIVGSGNENDCIVVHDDGSVWRWDLDEMRAVEELGRWDGGANQAAPGGDAFLSVRGTHVVWVRPDGPAVLCEVGELDGLSLEAKTIRNPVRALAAALCAEAKFVVVAERDRRTGTAYLRSYDPSSGVQTHGVNLTEAGADDVTCVRAFVDGKNALTGGKDGSVRKWHLPRSEQVMCIDLGPAVTSLALSSKPNVALAGLADGSARLLDLKDETVEHRLEGGHDAPVSRVAFGRKGNMAFTGDEDGVVVAWDVNTGEQVGTYAIPDDLTDGGKRSKRITTLFIQDSDGRPKVVVAGGEFGLCAWPLKE